MTAPDSRDAQSGVEAVLAGVLAEHGDISFDLGTPRAYTKHGGWNQSCGCGFPLGDAGGEGGEERVQATYRAHVAAMQAAALGPVIAAARAEALREAADEMEATIADLRPTLGGAELSYANCTRLDVRLLRDRANRYEAAQNVSVPICGPSSPEAGTDASDAERAAERGGER